MNVKVGKLLMEKKIFSDLTGSVLVMGNTIAVFSVQRKHIVSKCEIFMRSNLS